MIAILKRDDVNTNIAIKGITWRADESSFLLARIEQSSPLVDSALKCAVSHTPISIRRVERTFFSVVFQRRSVIPRYNDHNRV